MRSLLLVLLAACGHVHYVALSEVEREPLADELPVEVRVTSLPECPYSEVGILKAHARTKEKTFAALREKAREVGANVVFLRSYSGGHVEAVALRVKYCQRT